MFVRSSIPRLFSYRTQWLARRGNCAYRPGQHVIAPFIKPPRGMALAAGKPVVQKTYVPCFPVKPWKMTLVSLLMRRFSIVLEYGELAEL